MSTVTAKAIIIEDNTGVSSEIPIVLGINGEISVITDYLIKLDSNGLSISTIKRFIRSVSLFLDYMNANTNLFDNPKSLFQTFAKRLYTGTIGIDGLDPSGLYWIPNSTSTANSIISSLTLFFDWLSEHYSISNPNPLHEASTNEQFLNYAAWHKKNQNNFLGHIADKSINSTLQKARSIKGRSQLTVVEDDAIAFPEKYWNTFFHNGIGRANDFRIVLRDQLILLLMHGGGLRESEALSLWITDVIEDTDDYDSAIVRIYNEIDGKAPFNWKSYHGSRTRAAYLKENYGRIPRIKMNGTEHIGWKCKIVDHKDNYIQVQWFPSTYGEIFMKIWRLYLRYRVGIDCNHPYAFISFHKSSLGNPYTLNAFHQNYSVGLKRIGLLPNKMEGLGPHGHRHNYGRRLDQAGLSPLIIRRCMHHKSFDSQIRYTARSQKSISESLSKATQMLANSESKSLNWRDLIKYGFEDIDPKGYFVGLDPNFRKNSNE